MLALSAFHAIRDAVAEPADYRVSPRARRAGDRRAHPARRSRTCEAARATDAAPCRARRDSARRDGVDALVRAAAQAGAPVVVRHGRARRRARCRASRRAMVVARDALHGTIGGGHLEFEAIGSRASAARAARAGAHGSRAFRSPRSLGQCCGGVANLAVRRVVGGAPGSSLAARWHDAGTPLRGRDAARAATARLLVATARRCGHAGRSRTRCARRCRRAHDACGRGSRRGARRGRRRRQRCSFEPLRRPISTSCVFGNGHVGRALVQVLGACPAGSLDRQPRRTISRARCRPTSRSSRTDSPADEVAAAPPGAYCRRDDAQPRAGLRARRGDPRARRLRLLRPDRLAVEAPDSSRTRLAARRAGRAARAPDVPDRHPAASRARSRARSRSRSRRSCSRMRERAAVAAGSEQARARLSARPAAGSMNTAAAGTVAAPRADAASRKVYPSVVANDGIDLTVAARRDPRGARRERRRQVDADEDHLRRREARRRRDPLGRRAGRRSPTRRARATLGIGMVFQHFSLFETLTVAENIALALGPRAVARRVSAGIRASVGALRPAVDPRATCTRCRSASGSASRSCAACCRTRAS